jgi:hypothetical protein
MPREADVRDRQAARRSLIVRFSKVLSEIAQMRVDVASWNDAHPGAPPIDVDADGELARAEDWARQHLDSLREEEEKGG